MSYYLAASYSRREEIEKYARWLRRNATMVTSTWHDGHHELLGLACQAMRAKEDLYDLDNADALLFFSGGNTHSGGRHVEYGYALAQHKPIFIIGPTENIFHTLADQRFETFDDFTHNMGLHDVKG